MSDKKEFPELITNLDECTEIAKQIVSLFEQIAPLLEKLKNFQFTD